MKILHRDYFDNSDPNSLSLSPDKLDLSWLGAGFVDRGGIKKFYLITSTLLGSQLLWVP